MMKNLMIFLSAIFLAFGYSGVMGDEQRAFKVQVKDADVAVTINEEAKDYEEDQHFTLRAGDIICFEQGEGRVVIEKDDYKKQLSANNKSCKVMPDLAENSENKTEDTDTAQESGFMASITSKIFSLFSTSKEVSTDGVSRSTGEAETYTGPMKLDVGQKYIAIENNSWGPLPVTLDILDKQGKLVDSMVNEDEVETSFIIPVARLEDGYQIQIYNMLDETMVESTVQFE